MIARTEDEFRHPLTRGDDALTQDFILTKVTLLLAHGASAREWDFEIEAMRATTTDQARNRIAFLLDYTLARYIAAFDQNAHTAPDATVPAAARLSSLAREFTDAVHAENFRASGNIWSASQDIDDPATVPTRNFTLTLLDALRSLASSPVRGQTWPHIPAAYSSVSPMQQSQSRSIDL